MIRFYEDLIEHGIVADIPAMELILKMQEQDFNQVTEGINPDQEYMRLLNKIASM